MSYDYSLQSAACDHVVVRERYAIDFLDFKTLHYYYDQTLNMRAPINAPQALQLYFKGVLVPSDHPQLGYSCVVDPTRIQTGYKFLKVVFNQPVRMLNPLIELNYITRAAFCPKCQGSGVVSDWQVENDGSLAEVTLAPKLSQQILKYILTSNNPFNPALTCPVVSYLGQKEVSTITTNNITQAVNKILATYMSIQRAQRTVQHLDPQEMLKSVNSVVTTQSATDPTNFNIALTVTTYGSSQPIPVNLNLTTTGG